ncbi:MAG: glycosyltransferase family 39 protein [Chloroflexi bacterium]|nr:glycosyltransferase family 39 protein [Chloroflexota bacterium]
MQFHTREKSDSSLRHPIESRSGSTHGSHGSIDGLESLFLNCLLVSLVAAWVAFTLAEFGFDRPLIVGGIAVVGLVAAIAIVLRRRRVTLQPTVLGGLLLPLLIGVVLFFPPDEWILGGLDPGGYVNGGAAIARGGSIVIHDSILKTLSRSVDQELFILDGNRLPGFYIVRRNFQGLVPTTYTITADRVVPHAFHLFPVVLAFGYAVGGIRPELIVTPILALLGLASFFLLGRRLFGTTVAFLATTFLALSPAEVWFARYPDAEILAQLLLFGGLFAFVVTLDHPNRWTAILAGLALGEVHLDKIELLPLPFLIAAYLGYQAIVGKFDRRWFWLIGVYSLLVIQAILHAMRIASWYTVITLRDTLSPRFLLAVGAVVAVSVASGLVLAAFPKLRARVRRLITHPTLESLLSISLPAIIGILSLYAYFLRPLQAPSIPVNLMSPAQLTLLNNDQSFVRLGWFITPAGLLFGTLGWLLLTRHQINRRTALPLLIIAVDCFIFLSDMRITPVYYWAARRWIPLVIPGFCLAAAYFITNIWERRHVYARAMSIAFSLIMVGGLVLSLEPLFGYVEYRGAIDQLSIVADEIPANGVVFFADGDAGIRFSVPLEYVFQRTSILVPNNTQVQAADGEAARTWSAQGHPIYWITTTNLPGPSEIGLTGTVIDHQTIALPEKLATRGRPPGAAGVFKQDLVIWKLNP